MHDATPQILDFASAAILTTTQQPLTIPHSAACGYPEEFY